MTVARLILVILIIGGMIASLALPITFGKVTKVEQHVFAKGIDKSTENWKPVNVTNSFSQDDQYAYAFTEAFYSRTNFTWQWYEPDGKLYRTASAVFDCGGNSCPFYDRISIQGSDAADKIGTWRMDLLADGAVLYSDDFTLSSVIVEQLAWVFDVNSPRHANVNMTVTIQPHGEKLNDYTFSIGAQVGNFNAFEYGTQTILGVETSKEGSLTKVTVVFHAAQGVGYRFTVSFGLASEFGKMGNATFLMWTWNTGSHPRPENVTVILPAGFDMVSLEGDPKNFSTNVEMKRTAISFSGVAQPYGSFHWIITYGPLRQTSPTTTASTTAPTLSIGGQQSLLMLASAIGGLAVILVAVLLIKRQIRHR